MGLENDVKSTMQSSLEHFKKELATFRTNRANPSILDNVFVEVYGSRLKLKDLAHITVPESRQLLITPYDMNNLQAILKAIEAANLNLQPKVETNAIRINTPPMDESMRKEIAKKCKKESEDAKIAIREIRRKYNDMVKKQKASGEITEDIMKREEKVIQKYTDKFCKDIEEICSKKEKDILEI